jgi:hypothetical protein
VVHPRERHAAQPVGNELRLALSTRRQRAVREAVLGVLLLAVTHEIEVMRHGVDLSMERVGAAGSGDQAGEDVIVDASDR